MFHKSIRFKITVIYMAVLALTLTLFSAILYHYVSRNLYENMDTLLRSKAEDIVDGIKNYWSTEKFVAGWYGANSKEAAGIGKTDLASIAHRWVGSKSKDPKLLDIIVQIFDPDGVPLASSKNTQGMAGVSRENLIAVLQGNNRFDTVSASFPTRKAVPFRVFITPAIQDNKVEYIVQVTSPLASINDTLNILKVTLFLLFPVTILFTGIMGAFIAKLTLQPVDGIIKSIHDITADNLRLKLLVPDTRDEIQELAETFNEMLLRLDNAFTSQRQLFEDLSHELKTPLTILKGEFEVVLKRMRSHEEYESILRSALEEIDKLAKLVENMLMLASLESRKLMPERKEIDLVLLVQAAINKMKWPAEKKGLAIQFMKGASPILIEGDEKQVKIMVINLIDNAIKYTPAGGAITVEASKENGLARITIKDTGIGIPKEDTAHIFDRFYRVDKSRTDYGFGLGLSIVRSVVETHNGTIKVASAQGKGTTFTISLPAH